MARLDFWIFGLFWGMHGGSANFPAHFAGRKAIASPKRLGKTVN
jgi:hypothetical protein